MNTSRAVPRFGAVDAVVVAASLALGVWVTNLGPLAVESTLGLGKTQEKFEAEKVSILEMRTPDGKQVVPERSRIVRWRNALIEYGNHILPFVTLGAFAATFRHRGSWSRQALRRCGVLTTAVAGLFVAASLASEFVLRRFPILEVGYSHNFFDSLWWELGIDTGQVVAALWATLALGGRWRARPSGFDRLGRIVGAVWLLHLTLGHLLVYLSPYSWFG